MSRPMTLREAASVAISGQKSFGDSIDEFLDTFYLDHPDKKRQQERIDDSPPIIGNPSEDAWVGAVGEHLARRWDLEVPAWTRRPEHYLLDRPKFVPDSRALRSILICESPAGIPVTNDIHVRRTTAKSPVSSQSWLRQYASAGFDRRFRDDDRRSSVLASSRPGFAMRQSLPRTTK